MTTLTLITAENAASAAAKTGLPAISQNRQALITNRTRRNIVLFRSWLSQPVGRVAAQEAICDEIRAKAASLLRGEALKGVMQSWALESMDQMKREIDTYFSCATICKAREMAEIEIAAEIAADDAWLAAGRESQ